MGLLTRPVRITLTTLFAATALVAIAVGVTGWWLGIGPAGDESDGAQSVAEAQIDTNYPIAGNADASVNSLPLPALVEESDVVIIATVEGRSKQWRRPAGGIGLTSLGFDYFLSVERYLKGDGEPSLALQKPVAMEVADRNSTHVFDSTDSITVGERYFFFLEGPENGTMRIFAEPFRFRIVDGLVHAESTIGVAGIDHEGNLVVDKHTHESDLFPVKSELDFTRDVSALVATAATELR